MEIEKIKCKIITPLLMTGADGRTPELRPPSIKGMMRFWWRAVNGHLSLEELKKRESDLFGASNEKVGKSKIRIRIQSGELDQGNYFLLPHKNMGRVKVISPNQDLSIILSSYSNIQDYSDILNLCLILGGFGKRSRRGFGSLEPEDINLEIEDILELINRVGSSNYDMKGEKIVLKESFLQESQYPYLKEVIFGGEYEKWEEVLESIGTASSKCCNRSLGFTSSKGRLASPIYVSVLKNSNGRYFPIISTLNTVFNKDSTKRANFSVQDKLVQDKFKEMIL
ncbi:CRISPR-associated protein Cmr1 [Methanosarcina thermophila]|uniref:CRISPR-associated protein Cmr1 n=1 Tax=Methanosarcina thermophila TaxID=2210 RepID=A0A1I6ZNR4_METTE|nr:type III-B CRISPR module RAMP protein Cmr1 [Methanosarcina thermophila]SFT64359.1 CRISPR-associated protein Cmr1 [Methanosarcina thermophila]HOA69038.1 type III-B CRISPR module RAMP protein Cmr1 [Methanosarcina thermophila]HPZ20183.1 type III-B CRISPR module RAMP protein Cmr1 [Methanosarcina thermophila]HQD94584.1 type III-B CRISPR module RAMP protein Cmr1 [Methanosarcina thermophila]